MREVLVRYRAKLEPLGWRVELRGTGPTPGVSLVFSHPLSSDTGFVVGADMTGDRAQRFLSAEIGAWETSEAAVINDRPEGMDRWELGVIRSLARAYDWNEATYRQALTLLDEVGFLSRAEQRWLSQVGPRRG